MSTERFIDTSPWLEEPATLQPALTDSTSADVVIVGGGLTGLSAALSLRTEGADVVVLEREFAGSGASGRNAGHLTPTIGKDLPTVLRLFGRERALELVKFADAAVDYTVDLIRERNFECDYMESGNLLAAVHSKHTRRLEKAAETARGLGAHVRFLPTERLRERGVPPAFVSAVLEERGGTLHPGRYVSALRNAAIESGVRLFEQTNVREIVDGAKVTARTNGGDVSASSAVLATNAYTASTGRRVNHVMPVRVSLFETEKLDEATLETLDWKGREGIYTSHEALENYRLTAHGTLTGGSKVVRYHYGGALPSVPDPKAFTEIEKAFRERFPTLSSVPIAHFWGGWIGMTVDFIPQFGCEGGHDNVHYGIGFNGHGVAQATLVGSMLARRVLGGEHELAPALRRRLWAWPPEPLRWIGAKLLIGGLALIDARTDRQTRRASR
jgi:glycine/D-amino acid oxidase-like deaminating enzyme